MKEAVAVRDRNGNGVTDKGDEIEYRLTVKNLGGVTLNSITVDDPLLGGRLVTIPTLAPGATQVLRASSYPQLVYVVTQANADAGFVTNEATAAATPANGQDPVTAKDAVTETISGRAGIALVKEAALSGENGLTYTFTVTNTGTQTLTSVAILDAMLSDTAIIVPLAEPAEGELAGLAPGQTATISRDYPLSQANIDAGSVRNQASVSGQTPGGTPVTDTSGTTTGNDTPTVTQIPQLPKLTLVKSASRDPQMEGEAAALGEVISYSFTLTNAGNVTLNQLEITDPLLAGGPIVLEGVSLLPGESIDIPADRPELASRLGYTVTQADINAGRVVNSATGQGKTPQGAVTTDVSGSTDQTNDPTTTALPRAPSLSLLKAFATDPAPSLDDIKAGFEVSYTFTVTNTGNVPVDSLQINDPKLAVAPLFEVRQLNPGESTTSAPAVYKVTQADIDSGVLANTATVSGRDVTTSTPLTSEASTVTAPIAPKLAISLVKEAKAPLSFSGPGAALSFQLTVTNTGNVTYRNGFTLADVLVTSDNQPRPDDAPQPQMLCRNDTGTARNLAPGESMICDVSYTTTQDDVNAGGVFNTATASVTLTPAGSDTPLTAQSNAAASVPAVQRPGLALTKFSNWDLGYSPRDEDDLTPERAPTVFTAGTEVLYRFWVENTGNTTLEGPVTIYDRKLSTAPDGAVTSAFQCHALNSGASLPTERHGDIPAELIERSFSSSESIALAPGRAVVCEIPYLLTPEDTTGEESGARLTNTATAAIGSVVTTPSSTTVPGDLPAELSLVKTLVEGDGYAEVGDTLVWEYRITNSGWRDLSNSVTIYDALIEADPLNQITAGALTCEVEAPVLSPQASVDLDAEPGVDATVATMVCLYTSTVTQADIDRGYVETPAYAQGSYATTTVDSPYATARAEAVQTPAFTLAKSVELKTDAGLVAAQDIGVGNELLYTITLTNTGNVSLNNATISDPMLSALLCEVVPAPQSQVSSTAATLAPQAALICTGSYLVTQADLNRGELTNTASGQAVTPQGTPVGPKTAQVSTDLEPQDAGLRLIKSVKAGLSTERPTEVGDRITYQFDLRFSGNVTLTNVSLSDPLISADPIVSNLTLTPRYGADGKVVPQTISIERDYVVTQDDINTLSLLPNQAFVTANTPSGPLPELPSQPSPETFGPTTEPLNREPSVEIEKTLQKVERNGASLAGSASGYALKAGDVAHYTIVVRNTGNVTLTALTVSDALIGWSNQIDTLAPGASQVFQPVKGQSDADNVVQAPLTLTLTQSQIDAGRVLNTALVTGNAASGQRVNDADDEELKITLTPGLTLLKTALVVDVNANQFMDAGDHIEYSFVVENTGNVTLSDLRLTDPMLGASNIGHIATLAPGAQQSIGPVSFAPTADMLAEGRVENTATVKGRVPGGGEISTTSSADGTPGTPTVSDLNRRPVAEDDLLEDLTTGTPVSIYVARNDSDPDKDDLRKLDPASVKLLDDNGQETDRLVVPGEGVWTVEVNDATGETYIEFTPEDGFTADPKVVEYVIKDGPADAPEDQKAVSEPGTITLKFTPVPPVAQDDSVTGQKTGEKVSVPVLNPPGDPALKDYDPDGSLDPESVKIIGAPGNGKELVIPGQGTWRVEIEGDETYISFDPLRDSSDRLLFTGSPEPIRYTVEDNDGNVSNAAKVTIGYTPVPPVAQDDLGLKAEVTRPITVDVLGGTKVEGSADPVGKDGDADGWLDPTSVQIVGGDNFGRVKVVAGEGRWTVDPETGAITFTPNPGYYGSPTPIQYTVKDNDGNISNEATVSLDYSAPPSILLKTEITRIDDRDGDGLTGEGDEIHYRFTVTNDGPVPVENVTLPLLTSPVNGAMLPGMVCAPLTLMPGESAVISCTGTSHIVTKADVEAGEVQLNAQASAEAIFGPETAQSNESTTVTSLSAAEGIFVEKTAGLGTVRSGQLVPYSIRVQNASNQLTVRVDVRDRLPDGLIYRKGTGRVGSLMQEPERKGQTLWFRDIELAPGASTIIELQVLVSGAVQPGPQVNRAQSFNPVTGRPNSREATATIMVDADPVFDCGTVIGTVFDDYNLDGYQNPGEPGIAGARLVTVRGTIITTDRHGRYHVPCADLPRDIGTNYVLKLDDRSLPTGYRITTENPGDVRLTAGKMVELNFGASMARLVRLDIDARAFALEDGEETLNDALRDSLKDVARQIRNTPSVMRIVYLQTGERERVVKSRLKLIERELKQIWRGSGRYGLLLETMIQKPDEKKN
ncbi:hypothetical protein Q9295_10675 [Xinfangfangia sp. CPCC 101601]|uniref:DUF11 domain-containing protein n=1 Tax=Pseudogemmobacter lacusdianii TaxID=3069608 RepID=A0ABU0VYL8_9RHOB|nr:hypothetical protein [Xinfangfangia sp. CPCC 101601]MDQ2066841.1 hypothetical protein [Xinfangfangia sp. CPCC 101601]